MSDPESDTVDWSIFGDSLGLAVFLVALVLAAGTWQVGFFITDTYAIANGLVNVADGHLTVDRIHYSLTLGSQPGLHVVDGRLYARNYGQIVAALPLYYGLEVLAAVTRLELLLAGSWSLLFLGTCRQVGAVLDRRRTFTLAGSVLAVGTFGASLSMARPLDPDLTGIVALQALSVLSVSVLALALYRSCTSVGDGSRRLGVAAGLGAVLVTPLWSWAAVPKRHVIIAAAVATLLFWFATSRSSGRRVQLPLAEPIGGGALFGRVEKALLVRTMAYALVALVAWVHAFEGVVLLAAFAVADLATVSTTSRRALLAVVVGLSVGLAPVLATNIATSGNPAEPPRLTESYSPGGDIELGPGGTVQSPEGTGSSGDDRSGGGETDSEPGTDGGGGEAGSGTGTDDGGGLAVGALADRIRSSSVVGYAERVIRETNDAPSRLYHTYVRSGRIGEHVRYDVNQQEAIELTLAESLPLVGGLFGVLLGWVGCRVRPSRTGRRDSRSDGGTADTADRHLSKIGSRVRGLPRRIRSADPAVQTDGFAVLVLAGYATLYFPLLPLHTQITVRYILPSIPVLVYLVARRSVVGRSVEAEPRALVVSYAVVSLVGLTGTVAVFPVLDLAVGEAMQLHALVNLGVCSLLLIATATARAGFIDDTRVTAAVLGVTGAATTVLVVRMQLVYFEYGTYAVPVVRELADLLAVAG